MVQGKIQEEIKGELKIFDSSVFHSGLITAVEPTLLSVFRIKNQDQILNKIDVEKVYWDFCRKNWKKLCELPGCETLDFVDLYRGDQVEMEYDGIKYKFNLWFCGKEVDCLFHNQHDFVEIHTNLAGDGYMQKCVSETDHSLVETVGLLPWTSPRLFHIENKKEKNGNPLYPFHRWLWGTTGNIWLVVEKFEK